MSAAATLVQPSISEEDLKALAEDVAAFVNRKIEGLATADDLQFLAEEVRKALDKRISSIPALVPDVINNIAPSSANIDVHVPEQPAPIVNVAPSAAAVQINVPEQPAPIVNVETAPAIVNVAPAAPAAAAVNVDLKPITAVLKEMQAQRSVDGARLGAIESTLADLVRQAAAPKDLVFDKDGKPTGIKTRGS